MNVFKNKNLLPGSIQAGEEGDLWNNKWNVNPSDETVPTIFFIANVSVENFSIENENISVWSCLVNSGLCLRLMLEKSFSEFFYPETKIN